MAGLTVSRVNFERRRVDVAQAVSEPRGAITWGTPKNHERRSVLLLELLMEALAQRCSGRKPDDLVFVGAGAGSFARATSETGCSTPLSPAAWRTTRPSHGSRFMTCATRRRPSLFRGSQRVVSDARVSRMRLGGCHAVQNLSDYGLDERDD